MYFKVGKSARASRCSVATGQNMWAWWTKGGSVKTMPWHHNMGGDDKKKA